MYLFSYLREQLHAVSVPLAEIAEHVGTPAYVYSRATLSRHYQAFENALDGAPHLVCYAVKANSNLAVLNVLARLGAGFDIVSGGELERVIRAGGDPDDAAGTAGLAVTAASAPVSPSRAESPRPNALRSDLRATDVSFRQRRDGRRFQRQGHDRRGSRHSRGRRRGPEAHGLALRTSGHCAG